jgi:hypothetical protein
MVTHSERKAFEKWDKEFIVPEILADQELRSFLLPYFSNDSRQVVSFVQKSIKRNTTRRMLLGLQWYADIADSIEKIRANRPALKLIFLMAMVEGAALYPRKYRKYRSRNRVVKFFSDNINVTDRATLLRTMKRALLSPRTKQLQFGSIIKIIYQIRNNAVHGIDFWSFSFKPSGRTTRFTTGWLVSKTRKTKTRVRLQVNLTYEEFRDIAVRTVIAAIRTC